MSKVRCYECKKTYDYDLNDFCPRCGAYTPPKKHLRSDPYDNQQGEAEYADQGLTTRHFDESCVLLKWETLEVEE